LVLVESDVVIEAKKTTNKEIVVNNFAVLTLTFTDSSNTPQTDVSVILKGSIIFWWANKE
jgi:hypothetical protein